MVAAVRRRVLLWHRNHVDRGVGATAGAAQVDGVFQRLPSELVRAASVVDAVVVVAVLAAGAARCRRVVGEHVRARVVPHVDAVAAQEA